jgi:hypothetical protein
MFAGTVGACLVALNGLALALEGMQSPMYRWGVWALAMIFLIVAAVKSKGENSPISMPDGQPIRQSNPQRKAMACIASVIFVLLIGDILIVTLRSPVEWTPITDAQGMHPEFDTDAPYSVAALDQVVSTEILADSPGISATSLLTRRPGIDHLLIRDLAIEVVRFEPMPDVKSVYGGIVELDQIEATFVVERKKSDFPWTFSPLQLSVNRVEIKRLPVRVTDSAPFQLAYCINARDPGIYWIRCIAWVSYGISPAKRIQLTPEPIPLGFYSIDTEAQPGPIDDLPLRYESLPTAPATE